MCYTNLYSKVPIDETAKDEFLSNIPITVTQEDNVRLLADITDEEIKITILESPRKKSPGSDGLPIEFYIKFWHVIGPEFTTMCNELLLSTSFPVSFTKGIVVQIPKKS